MQGKVFSLLYHSSPILVGLLYEPGNLGFFRVAGRSLFIPSPLGPRARGTNSEGCGQSGGWLAFPTCAQVVLSGTPLGIPPSRLHSVSSREEAGG